MTKAEGTFNLDFKPGDSYDDRDGIQLSRAHISKTFDGDLVGTSETDILTVTTAHPAAYAGVERFDGSLDGREGGFALTHNGGVVDGAPWMTWKIVETSGTGELAGIRGEGQIVIGPDGGHSYMLEYEICQ
jgi:Protein of unknown function (DUF3224)